jgi:hypothetical protein
MKYSKKWYNKPQRQCFFCYHFHSIHHTKAYILKRIKYHFEASNEKDQATFYEQYLKIVREWCEHYGIESTVEATVLERMTEEEIAYLRFPST